MSYMVIFRTPEGKPGYQQAEGVNEAVETVERLRNQDGVENVRIFRMEEVPFEYKVHYSVELKETETGESSSVSLSGSSDALSWDDDMGAPDVPPSGDPADEPPSQPFDQMAAVDHTEPPRWGEEGHRPAEVEGEIHIGDSAEDRGDDDDATAGGYGEYSAVSGARRGLFGR